MSLTKKTKNTLMFSADTEDGDQKVPQLYIKKLAFKGEVAPKFITVTIEEGQS